MARLSLINNRPDLGYFGVGLVNPKNSLNVGGAIRACGAYDGRFVAVHGSRHETKGNWRNMDTEGGWRRFPVYLDVPDLFSYLPYGVEPVAVEMDPNATSLVHFIHPPQAMYIFGPEDGGIPAEISVKCKHKVYIPTVYSLNLFVAVSTVLYDRAAKRELAAESVWTCPKCGSVSWTNLDSGGKHCNSCGADHGA